MANGMALNGLALIIENEKYSYINANGEIVFPAP
jgi:hypothetical protein